MTRARIAAALLLLAALLAGLAWWVLESSGVAIAETRRPGGDLRETRVWYVRDHETLWLEAGHPDQPWYLDIQRDPHLVLKAPDIGGKYAAAVVPGPVAHDHVRALLRSKYGLRDRILGWVIDTSESIAVRLVPSPGEERTGTRSRRATASSTAVR